MYRKLKRVWSHNDANYIPRFREVFPELNKLSSEELCDRWVDLGVDFYTDELEKVNPLVRITLPFALILIIIMVISLPFVFLITGNWGYSFSEKNRIYNWLKSLRLL